MAILRVADTLKDTRISTCSFDKQLSDFVCQGQLHNFLSLIFDDLVKRRIMGHCQYTSEYEQSQLVPEKQTGLFKT